MPCYNRLELLYLSAFMANFSFPNSLIYAESDLTLIYAESDLALIYAESDLTLPKLTHVKPARGRIFFVTIHGSPTHQVPGHPLTAYVAPSVLLPGTDGW